MKLFNTLICLAGMAVTTHGHMEMKDPPPFRSKFNTNVPSGNVDYSMTSPLATDGSNFPCKGYHKDFGTPAGKPVAEWTPGQSYKFSITGGASHGGGSCQASLSFDKGSTWKVIHSYIGNCSLPGESSFDFTLPSDTPAGDLIFGWTWFNKIGNREMYMNCAAITVKGSAKRSRIDRRASSEAMSKRPDMFVANAGGKGYCTIEGADLKFPDPGPDVTNDSQDTKPPGCGGDQSGGGGSDGGSQPSTGGQAGNNGQPSSSQPSSSQPSNGAQPNGGSQPSSGSNKPPGGVFITSPPTAGTAAAPTPTTTAKGDTHSSIVIVAPPPQVTTAPTNQPPTEPASPTASQTESGPASKPSSPATPPAPPTTPGGSGDASSMAQGTACTEEGQWNCVGGKQFQRCASGAWSSLIAMAAGTSCTPGKSNNLAMTQRSEMSRRDAVEVELEF